MLYDVCMDYFEDLGVINADRFLPYYLASIGCHIAHLKNNHYKEFPHKGAFHLNRGAAPAPLRLHLLFITIPGGGKSYFTSLFANDFSGLLHDTRLQISEHNYMTEAGLCGTASRHGKQVYKDMGIAEQYPTNMLCFEEFATAVNTTTEGQKLTNQLLTLLDSGRVAKGLGVTEIKFKSWVSMWASTQNARLDLRSGLDRRFLIFGYSPTEDDRRLFLKNIRSGYHVKPSMRKVAGIRRMINHLYDNFNLQELEFTDEYEMWQENLADRFPGFRGQEAAILDRFAIGYTIMRYYDPGDKGLTIDPDEDLIRLAEASQRMRQDHIMDSEAQIVCAMLSHEYTNRREFIRNRLIPLGYSYRQAMDILNRMDESGFVQIDREPSGSGRKAMVIRLREDLSSDPDMDMRLLKEMYA